ncbi:MAG: hypothetical protein BWY71_02318 [Planctomycetes bacterium ADurb.Bin412]|nr:MAG: hypothetical protein BWY71_02318 [Planctomycetes bacterium ADurb.Bin412]
MRNSHGPALFNLPPEKGNYRTRRADNIAEPHGHKFRAVSLQRLHDKFSNPFAGPHYIGRTYGFIRGNKDKSFHTVTKRCFHYHPAAQDIIEHRLPGIFFQHRHMLICGGMKYHLRFIFFKNIIQEMLILHVTENRRIVLEIFFILQLCLYFKQIFFARIQHDNKTGLEFDHLTAKLRTNRTTTTGNEHRLPVQIMANHGNIQTNRRPP